MKKISFSTMLHNLMEAFKRFPFVIFTVLGLASLFYLRLNEADVELKPYLWIFFSLSIFLQLSLTLWFENTEKPLLRILPNLIGIIILLLYALTLPDELAPHQFPQHFILGFLLILSCFVVAFLKKNQDDAFWVFAKKSIIQLVVTYVFAGILLGGLSLAAYSLDELFGVNISDHVYENLSITCMLIFGPLYLLSNIPGKDEKYDTEFDFNKILKILGLYILLPVLILYTLILYVYMIQIVAKWELPNGWVSTLISVLALTGFICMLIVYPLTKTEQNKVVLSLSRYFPLILIPLLILMSVGIAQRVQDYGFTINRLYVVILNVWFYGISIYLFISKSRHLKWIIISMTVIGLIFSVGPLSVFQLNKNMMMQELSVLIQDAGLLKSDKINLTDTWKSSLDEKRNNRTYDLIRYLKENYSYKVFEKFYSDSISESDIGKLEQKFFYRESINMNDDVEYQHFKHLNSEDRLIQHLSYQNAIEIDNYRGNMDKIFHNDSVTLGLTDSAMTLKLKDKTININMHEIFKRFSVMSNDIPYSMKEATFSGKDYQLIITNISFMQKDKGEAKYEIKNIKGILFFN